jgi:hypothetical protein
MWLPVHAPCPVVSVPLFPARDQAAVRHFFPQSAWAVRIARPLVYVVALDGRVTDSLVVYTLNECAYQIRLRLQRVVDVVCLAIRAVQRLRATLSSRFLLIRDSSRGTKSRSVGGGLLDVKGRRWDVVFPGHHMRLRSHAHTLTRKSSRRSPPRFEVFLHEVGAVPQRYLSGSELAPRIIPE